MKQYRQPPTVNLTFETGIHVKVIFEARFWVCSFLGVSFLCTINLDNRVLHASSVELLKTKFTISLSELQVDQRFLLVEMNIFLFQLEFSSVESKEIFTKFTDPANRFSSVGKNVK